AGYETILADSAEAAINYLDISRPHLVISDMQMSGMDGMALFEYIHRHIPTLPVIILTAFGTIQDAVAATQRGIFGYLTKPYNPKILLSQVARAIDLAPVVETIPSKTSFPTWRKAIITRSALMEDLLAKVDRVAQGDASVLLSGESGV